MTSNTKLICFILRDECWRIGPQVTSVPHTGIYTFLALWSIWFTSKTHF